MQVARTEREAYDVVRAELERSLPGASAVVLNRNNSANRLEAATEDGLDPELAERLRDADPDTCVAVRRGRSHARGPAGTPLLACTLCGGVDGATRCVPSLVGGEVIGSVLVRTPEALDREDAEHLEATVAESAPTVAMLRSLAIAEARASTDALTGLANSRSIQDTLKRMVAHAGRTATPLAAILFDLDHFKAVNDTFGHSAGDEVLAAVGDVAASVIRDSDFVGRYGGEEFVVLLPDTGADGATVVAEKLGAAIRALRVPSVDRQISASLGVAAIPEHAGDAASLLRCADRALYAAKRAGRDRVEVLSVDLAG
jgi:diguanylate cyclase (GGDEF)-like protein